MFCMFIHEVPVYKETFHILLKDASLCFYKLFYRLHIWWQTEKHAVEQLQKKKIKMSTKLYLLFTVVKDNKKCTYQYRVKLSPFQPYELRWEGKRS